MNDDELLSRLRASFQATAARTPIGDDRANEITLDSVGRRSHAFVVSMSAAAAVAVIGGVTAVAASSGSHSSGVPALAAAGSSSGQPSPSGTGATCVPENYYVVASASEIAPLSYVLPASPAGYDLYGAWGTISRNKCAATATWYVEYDKAGGYANTDGGAIQLEITTLNGHTVTGDALRGEFGSLAPHVSWSPSNSQPEASRVAAATSSSPELGGVVASTAPSSAVGSLAPTPSGGHPADPNPGWTPVAVGAYAGRFFGTGSFGTLVWGNGDLVFQLAGPLKDSAPSELVQLAKTLVHVSPTDPRVKAPTNCQVPAGWVCPG